MKITGEQIREALKLWELRKSSAEETLQGTLFKFQEEVKPSTKDVVATILQAEMSIAQLQVAQMRYNLAVRVRTPHSPSGSLAAAIKTLGVAERYEKRWKGLAVHRKASNHGYGHNPLVRNLDANVEHAQATISPEEILTATVAATKITSSIRAAIAKGNATEVEIEDLDPALFE